MSKIRYRLHYLKLYATGAPLPATVPQTRLVSTGSVSMGSAAKFHGVTEEGIINASLEIESPTNRAALLSYLSQDLIPEGLVYWTSATTRYASSGSVTLAQAAKFHGVSERVLIASTLASTNTVNRANFLSYLTAAIMPKGLVYWVPAHINTEVTKVAAPISRKLAVSILTSVLTIAAAYAVTKLGLHESVGDAALVSGLIGQAAGFLAGYLAKEVPGVFNAPSS
jgi:hypothetical protein